MASPLPVAYPPPRPPSALAASSRSHSPSGARAGRARVSTLLVVGDSISAAYGLAPGTGWVDLLAARLDRAKISAIASSTRASPATRPPAGARDCRRCSPRHKPAIVVVELGGNDGLRGGDLASDARQPRRDGRGDAARRSEAAHRRNEAAAQLRRARMSASSTRCSPSVAKARKVPLVPFFFEGFGERNEHVPVRSHPPDRRGAAAAPRQRLAALAAAPRKRR